MNKAEAERRIANALKKEGFSPRIKKDDDNVHVIGLKSGVCRVIVPKADLSAAMVDEAAKTAIWAYSDG